MQHMLDSSASHMDAKRASLTLCRFASCFGDPVAAMFTALVGNETTFNLELKDEPSNGVPDFWFADSNGSVLLLGEGKVCVKPVASSSGCRPLHRLAHKPLMPCLRVRHAGRPTASAERSSWYPLGGKPFHTSSQVFYPGNKCRGLRCSVAAALSALRRGPRCSAAATLSTLRSTKAELL